MTATEISAVITSVYSRGEERRKSAIGSEVYDPTQIHEKDVGVGQVTCVFQGDLKYCS
jgi:hypothetical protein